MKGQSSSEVGQRLSEVGPRLSELGPISSLNDQFRGCILIPICKNKLIY